ncbi:MAG: flagellin [Methanosarcina sp.]|uniref:archaellin/type IV pilin N-terminal domain-containing protein n=1 Tax=Methanosarcina sp. TaxID=2213 RepID=UPI0026040F63|nr:archaellin/type IV pilin N-terminal domain-containing protein [Methanosarcina sp.]MDD3246905.1 flagellin [Methanosarcina sp.]MDD4248278.1 flagellin [Methanosarcina sp.]
MWNKLIKDEKGFTGLEAAIVLVAFVVVAAVFSYVMLGAGFYTTQKSQEVVHTGVMQASSSVELSGDLVATGENDTLKDLNLFIQLTSGGSSVDVNKTLIVFSSPTEAPTELTLINSGYSITTKYNGNTDDILDKFEKFELKIPVNTYDIGPNEEFQIEIKPPQGASYTIHRQAPPSIDAIMVLV